MAAHTGGMKSVSRQPVPYDQRLRYPIGIHQNPILSEGSGNPDTRLLLYLKSLTRSRPYELSWYG